MPKKKDLAYLADYRKFKSMWLRMTKENPMKPEIAAPAAPPAIVEPLTMTAAEIRSNVNLIQQVIKSVFIKDVHYGVIPGTPKPTLYKPGAEYLMVLFRLNAKPLIEDLSTADEIRYRVSILITHQITRHEIGWGVGECSSNETKYKWIKSKFPSEWEATPETHRRKIWKEGRDKPYEILQVRANIADVANTILKMAKKRALVDACLTCTAASDVFEQDIEDMPEGLRQSVADASRPPMPQRMSEKEKAAPAPAAAQQQEEDPNDSVEDPPTKDARRAIDIGAARPMAAKFDAPCRVCNVKIMAGAEILYVGDGNDKGRYHKGCVRQI